MNKSRFLPLLLLGDEQETRARGYLRQAELYALYDPDLKTVCAVKVVGEVCEICNIATHLRAQGCGYGRRMIDYLCRRYADRCTTMLAGTGESPLTLPFYERCGFTVAYREKDHYLKYYDHPIYEGGVQLVDKIYLTRQL
ncbi:MAG: GNAT family N-acetyltransferase [Clostridia bacterium]|nr:GNAT family N-acetyltransferase [Clostridia bacterium]